MQHILLVEDDATIAFGIETYLGRHGFAVTHVATLAAGRAATKAGPPFALALLDWNLPDGTGGELCAELKEQGSLPVIFLTVRSGEADIVEGLDMGADDYVVKPFALAVLLSRINAVLRRAGAQPPGTLLRCGPITVDRAKTTCLLGGAPIPLTAGEYRLLCLLLENKGRTLTRAAILESLWDIDGDFVNDNTLTVTIKRLRDKLAGGGFIKTIRGIGYRAEDEHGQ